MNANTLHGMIDNDSTGEYRDKVLNIRFLFLTGDVLFARGKSYNHVQHRREERSGAKSKEHFISISCTYSSFS